MKKYAKQLLQWCAFVKARGLFIDSIEQYGKNSLATRYLRMEMNRERRKTSGRHNRKDVVYLRPPSIKIRVYNPYTGQRPLEWVCYDGWNSWIN